MNPIWLAHIFQMGWWKTTNQLPNIHLVLSRKKALSQKYPVPSFRESCPSPTNREKGNSLTQKCRKNGMGRWTRRTHEGIIFNIPKHFNAYLPTFGSFPWNMPLFQHTLDLTNQTTQRCVNGGKERCFFRLEINFHVIHRWLVEASIRGALKGAKGSTWYLLVKLARDRKHEFSPQMVVKSTGNPRKFQGNLGWWNIIIWPDTKR